MCFDKHTQSSGLSEWLSGEESACQCRRRRRLWCDPWVQKIPWSRQWQPIPVFLAGKSRGQRGLAGYITGVAKNLTQLSDMHAPEWWGSVVSPARTPTGSEQTTLSSGSFLRTLGMGWTEFLLEFPLSFGIPRGYQVLMLKVLICIEPGMLWGTYI